MAESFKPSSLLDYHDKRNISATTMQYSHKRLKRAAAHAEKDREMPQRAGSIPVGVCLQRKPPPMRMLRPNGKLQYGSSPASAPQSDGWAEGSLIQEMRPSVSVTIPAIPSTPQARRMISPPILPSISPISIAIYKLSSSFLIVLPEPLVVSLLVVATRCLLAKARPEPDLRYRSSCAAVLPLVHLPPTLLRSSGATRNPARLRALRFGVAPAFPFGFVSASPYGHLETRILYHISNESVTFSPVGFQTELSLFCFGNRDHCL